jgi:cyclase
MRIGIGILLLLPATSSRAQTEFDQIQVRAERVAGNVHVLYGGGGNIGVSAGRDGILLVDDQYAPLAPKIRAALRTIAGDRPVRFVLNTHWHGDHTGGNEIFGESAPIIAQENVRKRLITGGVLSTEGGSSRLRRERCRSSPSTGSCRCT